MHPEIVDKFTSLALLVGGFVLIIYSVSVADLLNSNRSRLLARSPAGRTTWLLVGGALAAVGGAAGLLGVAHIP